MIDGMKIIGKPVYHRNGITGEGFYAVHGTAVVDGVEEDFVATVDAEERYTKTQNPSTRVLMLDSAGGVNLERTMRGDNFHHELCKLINEWKKED